MAKCWKCGTELPGNERICRECYSERYAEVVEGRHWSIRDDWQELRRTPVTNCLVLVNVLLFVAMAASAGTLNPSAEHLKKWGADFAPLTLNGHWWRLFTSAFLHANDLHLAFNMLGLLALGSIVERAYGRVVFLGVYLACIFAASSNSMVWHSSTVAIGASGGIFGLLGFLIPPLATGELSLRAKKVQNPAKAFAMSAAYNLVIGAIVPFIDNAAHIGGLFTGLVLGLAFSLLGKRVTVQFQS